LPRLICREIGMYGAAQKESLSKTKRRSASEEK
jgi:hypothetical protein